MTRRLPTELHGYHRKLGEHLARFRESHGRAAAGVSAAALEHDRELEKARAEAAAELVAETSQEPS